MDIANLSIRSALISDLEAILEVEHRAYQPPWSRKQFEDCFNDRYQIEVVFDGHILIAYWVLQPILDELHILNFCVNPDYHNQGIGKALLSTLTKNATQQAMSRILLEVRRSNKAARALYKACNFEFMGTRKNYYPTFEGAREDAITMELLLGE